MVRKPGSKHSASSSRVLARRNDWNSIRDLHQGPRSLAASRGRIHDRSPILRRKPKKPLPRGGRPYMTNSQSQIRLPVPRSGIAGALATCAAVIPRCEPLLRSSKDGHKRLLLLILRGAQERAPQDDGCG